MQKLWRYFTLFIFVIMMNPAHGFLYLIHDGELNNSVLFTIDSPYDTGILNRYPNHDLKALEAHPQKWELYAASGDDTDKAGYLYQVNPQNGDLNEGAKVLEDIPLLRELLVHIESVPRSEVIARFKKYTEVRSAIPNLRATLEGDFPNKQNTNSIKDTNWIIEGSCYTHTHFGQFIATNEKFIICMTYPNEKSAWISREMDIPEGVTSLPLSLDYNFLTQEYPGNGISEWDIIELSIKSANGNVTRLVVSSKDFIETELMFGDMLELPDGKLNIGQTGWQTFSLDVPVSPGKGEIKIMLSSEGEGNDLHSALLVDNIHFVH